MAEVAERPPTRNQQAIAEALADPKHRTVADVARAVGVNRTYVYEAIRKPSVTKLVSQIAAERSDTAPAIHKLALKKLAGRLDDGASDQLVLGAVKVTADVMASLPAEEKQEDCATPWLFDVQWVKRCRRRYAFRVAKLMAKAGLLATVNSPIPPESAP